MWSWLLCIYLAKKQLKSCTYIKCSTHVILVVQHPTFSQNSYSGKCTYKISLKILKCIICDLFLEIYLLFSSKKKYGVSERFFSHQHILNGLTGVIFSFLLLKTIVLCMSVFTRFCLKVQAWSMKPQATAKKSGIVEQAP